MTRLTMNQISSHLDGDCNDDFSLWEGSAEGATEDEIQEYMRYGSVTGRSPKMDQAMEEAFLEFLDDIYDDPYEYPVSERRGLLTGYGNES